MRKRISEILRNLRPSHLLAVLFLVFIFYVSLAGLPAFFTQLGSTFQNKTGSTHFIRTVNEQYEGMLTTKKDQPLLQNKGTYINFNGFMADFLQQPLMNDRVKLKNGHLAKVVTQSPSSEEIHQAAENIIGFHNAQTARGGNFLFVMVSSQISKYEDLLPVGYSDTTNATADAFLSLLEQGGVSYLDLREEMQKEGMSVTQAYYTTDHHWKPETGFWAYGKILDKLAQMGAIDAVNSFYTDPENYTFDTYENTFLGSSGKRTGIYYAGLDDSTLIHPNFETDISIQIPERNLECRGRYEEVSYNTNVVHNYQDPDFYQENLHGLYGWGDNAITHWRNEKAPQQGKFLLIGESFGNVPFSLMSIYCSSCDEMDMRHYDDDFAAYFEAYAPDTIIVEVNVDHTISEFTDISYSE